MIIKLDLENFTTFDKLKLDLSPGVNVIIGKNGTGKTHILKAIYSMLTPEKEFQIDRMHKMLAIFLPQKITNLIRRTPNTKAKSARIKVTDASNESWEIGIHNQETFKYSAFDDIRQKHNGEVVYIPVKEMLANAPGFRSLYRNRDIRFEEIYDDIIAKAFLPKLKKLPPLLNKAVKIIEDNIGGQVFSEGEEFFLETQKGIRIEFTLLAEGFRKLALIMLLIQNGCIGKGSLLLWDEPETNMNPLLISLVVEILLEMEQEGVQIVLATHSYVLLKEFDLQRKKKNKLLFHALFEKDGQIRSESAEEMLAIKSNAIHEEFDSLYDREVERALDRE
jgi:AAA15 family ATPase/GTPase